jgi:protocatechuate 3,4-dioxygenase beta subunit
MTAIRVAFLVFDAVLSVKAPLMPSPHSSVVTSLTPRRSFLQAGTAAAAFFTVPGLFAEQLLTPAMTEGPFYPDKLPLDTDNDLLILNDGITPAVGEITHLTGKVVSSTGEPIRNAFVEIWQVDHTGSYLHKDGRNPKGNDANFQGYGRFLTDSTGEYYFRTIKPVRYEIGSGGSYRAPHIHVAVSQNGHRLLTTQLLISGDPDNDHDGVLKSVRDPMLRETILVDFNPLPDSKIGELSARFEIALGSTAVEGDDGKIRGGIARPQQRRGR